MERKQNRSATFGCVWLVIIALTGLGRLGAGEFLPTLSIGSEVYSNVTVTRVTATDLYFSHAQGMGNAKLKNLKPELQARFHFDAAKGSAIEQQQTVASQRFHQELAARKPEPNPASSAVDGAGPVTDDNGDPVVTKLFARSFRGQRPPPIVVEQWLTRPPEVDGKFVLVDFWATWCEPCRQSIPHLNALQAEFKDRLVVIGLSNESPDEMRKMGSPRVDFYVGTDVQARSRSAAQVFGIPHILLIDPQGIVRFEGPPVYLEAQALERLILKYSK